MIEPQDLIVRARYVGKLRLIRSILQNVINEMKDKDDPVQKQDQYVNDLI